MIRLAVINNFFHWVATADHLSIHRGGCRVAIVPFAGAEAVAGRPFLGTVLECVARSGLLKYVSHYPQPSSRKNHQSRLRTGFPKTTKIPIVDPPLPLLRSVASVKKRILPSFYG